MAFPITEKGGPRPLPSLTARPEEPESEGAWGGETEELGEVEGIEDDSKAPGPVTMDMLGFVTADARCGKCEHMTKDGSCAWTRTSVEPDDGCIFGFAEKTGEAEAEPEMDDAA